MNIRLAAIGAGRLSSRRIYPNLHLLPVELLAVCDLDRGLASSMASRFGAKAVYTDHKRLLEEIRPDAVIICTGPEGHEKLAIDAMEAGAHAYTEKPPAVTYAGAKAVQETARRTGLICMTGFKKRFAPAYVKSKAAIDSAEFGKLNLLSIDYAAGPTYDNDPTNPTTQFLLDFCVHILDLSRYLAGEVASVYAITTDHLNYAVNLRFEGGAIGTVALSSNRDWTVSTEKVEITGGPGQFISVENSISMVRHSGAIIADWHSPNHSISVGDSMVETGFAGELEEFCNAINEKRTPRSSISESMGTLKLYEMIMASTKSGQVIDAKSFA
ncbi:Gfo/Idh/MocA family oxidoreductase [Mesorhizobium sp. M0309]|uniref:Gfo/Idh/MocA family protein n=1 Tax=Mesorhizobium sp. M0309 TaxID=2956933 RepID=UPI003338F1D3